MFDVEILHLAEKRGYRVKEVGVCWQDDGDSRLELVAGNWRNLKDIFAIRFASGQGDSKRNASFRSVDLAEEQVCLKKTAMRESIDDIPSPNV
jgi:hypothetical protein